MSKKNRRSRHTPPKWRPPHRQRRNISPAVLDARITEARRLLAAARAESEADPDNHEKRTRAFTFAKTLELLEGVRGDR